MNLIELHILQSFPVTCLNRDDVGAPKSARFGGAPRARVSSQCWKRAIRTLAKDYAPGVFAGQRTRYVVRALEALFVAKGVAGPKAKELAEVTADAVGKLDDPEQGNVKTLLFFSPQELDAVVTAVLELKQIDGALADRRSDDKKKSEKAKKDLEKLFKAPAKELAAHVKDAADIAVFGRMVADDHTLTVEGAGLFSHALSTHAVSNELDFFSAVDDKKPTADDAGAGHIGTIEFNSACYYRYVGLNLDLLADEAHLAHFTKAERKAAILAFLKASVLAVPPARKNSMFGYNPPAFILGLRRAGQPLSLINAFESPVRGADGFVAASRDRLCLHWKELSASYGLVAEARADLPPESLDGLLAKLVTEGRG
jgi:CRISPR system Cascade subunit CasC